MTTYVKKGICAYCGKEHLIPEDKDWRFKCDNCGTYTIFFNQEHDVIVEAINSLLVIYKCGKCKEELVEIGMGDSLGIGFIYYRCPKCKTMYTATHY